MRKVKKQDQNISKNAERLAQVYNTKRTHISIEKQQQINKSIDLSRRNNGGLKHYNIGQEI